MPTYILEVFRVNSFLVYDLNQAESMHRPLFWNQMNTAVLPLQVGVPLNLKHKTEFQRSPENYAVLM